MSYIEFYGKFYVMIKIEQIHPVSDFVRNYKTYMDRIKLTKNSEVLTVNGKPECVIVDAEVFQLMSDAYEKARFVQAVNEGIESMNRGEGKPAEEAFLNIRKKLDL